MKRMTAVFAALASGSHSAHHGWSEYDSSKALKLTGKIVESGYEHPHGHVRLEAPGKTGTWCSRRLRAWSAAGCRRACSRPARSVTVEGYPNRDKPEEMRAERIIVNGKTVELR